MVHTTCAVKDCLSSSHKNKDLRFHQMPHSEERCKSWLVACSRPDLNEKSMAYLKNIFVCSLHFEKRMYGKKFLKKTSVPTLLLPPKISIHTHTKRKILSDKAIDRHEYYLPGTSSQAAGHTTLKQIDQSTQTPTEMTDHTSRYNIKKFKPSSEKSKDVTKEQFLIGCDKFLSPKLSAIFKIQIYLQSHCKNNRFSRHFKLFCLNMYYTSPLAYRFLSKTICLPSKSTLAKTYLPMKSKISEQMWDVLTVVVKNMSAIERECVLCVDKMTLKLNLSYNTKGDQIFGLHEVDGQRQPVAAGYAFTLLLRGIISEWKQPIDFSFSSSGKIDDQLKTWIIDTIKRLIQLGFNIRALVSDLSSDFLVVSKSLGISTEGSYFDIDGHKIYYIFDVPHLMKCIRNNLMNYNLKFDGKTAQWDDIVNMYVLDIIKDVRSTPRLTDAHIQPKSFQKQNVRLAIQVFSNSVVTALKSYTSAGILQVSNGTIVLIEIMNNLFDLLNSSDINSPKPYNKPYRGTAVQEELLKSSEILLNSIRIINKNNGRDVTNNIKFINCFIITINSFRQLCNDMKSEGYYDIFTRRINNDCLENFFRLVRQTAGICREPTCIQYTRAFRKMFLCNILNLSDATNCTEDLDSILTQLAEFTKNKPLH